VQHNRTKHVEVDKHFTKERLDNMKKCTPFLSFGNQLANVLTTAKWCYISVYCWQVGNRWHLLTNLKGSVRNPWIMLEIFPCTDLIHI